METFSYSICPSCDGVNRVPFASPEGKAPVCGRCKQDLLFHHGINEVSASQLTKLIKKSPLPVVVDFWAPWCGPCRNFAPVFEESALRLAGTVVFAKLNTEAHPFAGDAYRIRSIPTLAIFRNGLESARQTGALPMEHFLSWIQQVLQVSQKDPVKSKLFSYHNTDLQAALGISP